MDEGDKNTPKLRHLGKLEMEPPKHRKGLMITLAIDGEYCGFGISLTKEDGLNVRMFYISLKVHPWSESFTFFMHTRIGINQFKLRVKYEPEKKEIDR